MSSERSDITGPATTMRFSYDINGLLEVDAQVPESGETKQLVIVDEDADVKSSARAPNS